LKRLALVALLLASSPVVSAPAPLPKPQRKAERPAAQQSGVAVVEGSGGAASGQAVGAI
jgi:hypothetical protein